ncbi:hypothetical protein J2T13_001902 [Paenibacillus sp. DS2015]|uniref:hypothetical protein n=1 Tax=Paenibacillus sp. DS2015 TaxID=3373917 RepID=UPI003D22571F
MSIKGHEFRKIFRSPVILGLIVVFIGFNLFLIFSKAYMTQDLAVLNRLVDRIGYAVTDEMQLAFDQEYAESLRQMNEITEAKIGKTYDSAAGFTSSNPVLKDNNNPFTQQEIDTVVEFSIIESYYTAIPKIITDYDTLDMNQLAESALAMQTRKVSNPVANTIKKQYADLSVRLAELKGNGEHLNLFFMGKVYKMHSFLFKNILNLIIYQLMILVVLMTAHLLNYEFENKTHLLTYSTRKGRQLMLDKLLVSIAASILVTTVIVGVTLATYFMVFNYSGLWQVPISSAFNAEYDIPYISWWNMSFIAYLLWTIVLIYICQVLFVTVAFIITAFIRNSYFVFFVFGLVFGVIVTITSFIPPTTNIVFVPFFNPFYLILNSHRWFMLRDVYTTFKYYEIVTIGIWSVLLLIVCSLCLRRFKRQNIV